MKFPSNIGCRTKEFFANLKCPNCFSKKVGSFSPALIILRSVFTPMYMNYSWS